MPLPIPDRRKPLSSLTGEFLDARQEAEFRRSVWPVWFGRGRTLLIVGMFAHLLTSANDYVLLGPGAPFYAVIAARIIVTAEGLWLLWAASRTQSLRIWDYGQLGFMVLLISACLIMMAVRPDGVRVSAPAGIFIICVFYMVPMTRLWITALGAAYLSIGALVVGALIDTPTQPLFVLGVQLFVANLVGYFVCRGNHRDARIAWRDAKALDARARADELIARLTVQFMPPGAEAAGTEAIQNVLEQVGRFTDADRCGFYSLGGDNASISCVAEWHREGALSNRENFQNRPAGAFGWGMPQLLRGEVVNIPRVADLAAQAGAEKAACDKVKARALLLVPVISVGRVVGFASLASQRGEREWSGDCILLLRMIGEMIVNVRLREQAEAAQRQRAVELEELNLELERRNADLQKLAYVTSHDLREPLRTIASFSDLLARNYSGRLDANADEYIRFLTGAAKRLHRQINDLLQYTRMESQDRPHVDCDLNEVADVVLANQAETARTLGAAIDCGPLPQVHADPLQMIQLLQHLVANALRFRSAEKPRITIGAKRLGDEWLIVVADNGVGVPVEHANRIFEMFQRLQPGDAGTGMGLAVCRRIVERHRGRIWVEPNAPLGSRFCFSLPVRLDRDNPQRAA